MVKKGDSSYFEHGMVVSETDVLLGFSHITLSSGNRKRSEKGTRKVYLIK